MIKNIKKQIKPAAGLVAGGVAANFVNSKLAGTIGNDKLRSGAIMLAGILISGQKGELIKNVGAGMLTVGGMKLVASFVPSLAGVCGVEGDIINGLYDDVITEDDLSGIINGDDEISDGDDY